jgi:hypothetical protein
MDSSYLLCYPAAVSINLLKLMSCNKACGGLAPTSVMAPTDERTKRTKIALIPQVWVHGRVGRLREWTHAGG